MNLERLRHDLRARCWAAYDELADNWRRYLRNTAAAYLLFQAIHYLVEHAA